MLVMTPGLRQALEACITAEMWGDDAKAQVLEVVASVPDGGEISLAGEEHVHPDGTCCAPLWVTIDYFWGLHFAIGKFGLLREVPGSRD